MTVKELINQLLRYPDNREVFLAERKTDYAFGLLNTVGEKEINFMEEPDGEVIAADTVIILDED